MEILVLYWSKSFFMKKLFFFSLLGLLVFCDADAQFKKVQKSTPPVTGTSTAQPPATSTNVPGKNTPKSTTGKTVPAATTSTTNVGTTTPNSNTQTIVPGKRFDTARETGGREYGAEVKASRRVSFAYRKESVNDRKVLAYDDIREDDATYSQFVWREIDAREKMNLPFIYSAKEEGGDQRFFSILLSAIKNDSVVAFSAEDDRFTTPLSYDDVISSSTSKSTKLDTSYQENPNDENIRDTIIFWKENLKAPKPDSIYKFRIKEQWVFDKESSRMLVRIIGIAPLAPNPLPPGIKKQTGPTTYYPLFWLYYPDLRPTLARSFAYNPKNAGGRQTWEEIFEGRFFSSNIIKSSLNNSKDKPLAQLIKDPLFQLLEGENIKEKIFNYEQDLWSY
jgi:gliding motility associated protien GldN